MRQRREHAGGVADRVVGRTALGLDALPAQAGVEVPLLAGVPLVLRIGGDARGRGVQVVAEVPQALLRRAVDERRAVRVPAVAFAFRAEHEAVLVLQAA
jgi:hypothetical protein